MPELSLVQQDQMDPALQRDGVWHDLPLSASDEPLRLKLRSLASDKVRKWEQGRWKQQRHLYTSGGALTIAQADQNEIDRLAEAVVVDWNLTEGGQPMPCDTAHIRQVMTAMPDLRRKATALAGQDELYRLATLEALAGNSARPSSPTSDTGAEAP